MDVPFTCSLEILFENIFYKIYSQENISYLSIVPVRQPAPPVDSIRTVFVVARKRAKPTPACDHDVLNSASVPF